MSKPQSLIDQLCAVALAYCRAKGLAVGTVSTHCFGDGNKLGFIMEGKADLTTARFERSIQWFADNWPRGAAWPDGCKRPVRSRESA